MVVSYISNFTYEKSSRADRFGYDVHVFYSNIIKPGFNQNIFKLLLKKLQSQMARI